MVLNKDSHINQCRSEFQLSVQVTATWCHLKSAWNNCYISWKHRISGEVQIVIYGNNSASWVQLPDLSQLTSQHLHATVLNSKQAGTSQSIHASSLRDFEERIPSHYYFLHTRSGTLGTSFGSLCFSFPICRVGYCLASLGTVEETTQFHDKKRSFQQIWALLEELYPCQASLIAIMPTAFQQRLFSQWFRLSPRNNTRVLNSGFCWSQLLTAVSVGAKK